MNSPLIVMAGLEPATQGQRASVSTAPLHDPSVAGSRFACPAMTEIFALGGCV